MIKNIVCLISFLSLATVSNAQEERKFVREGNKDYKSGSYVDAEVNYLRALEVDSMSVTALFNLSDALYQQNRYDDALKINEKILQDSLQTEVKHSDLAYNLGNGYFQKKEYDKAVETYKKSLRENPSDMDAKFNLAYAQLMLQNQQDQENEDNKDNEDNQDNKDNKNNQDNKDNEQDQKDDKQDQDDQQDQNDKQDEQENQEQPSEGEMSKKEAEQLLQAIQNNEDKTQEKVNKQKAKGVVIKNKKNW